MNDFLTFRRMIVPIIIQVIFWVGVALCLIWGIAALADRHNEGWDKAAGVLIILLGPFVVRIYCEFLIVVFRINETLGEIRRDLRLGAAGATGTLGTFCSKCGKENPSGSAFCRSCGQSLAK